MYNIIILKVYFKLNLDPNIYESGCNLIQCINTIS